MAVTLTLGQEDAALLYLAIAYHLARPGSELDAETKQPVEHGLAETSRKLRPLLRQATATIELNDFQLSRLHSAILGAVNELKVYPMLETRPAAGFAEALRKLFPTVADDPNEALALAERLVMLRRRLTESSPSPPDAPPPPQGRPWWRRLGRRR